MQQTSKDLQPLIFAFFQADVTQNHEQYESKLKT